MAPISELTVAVFASPMGLLWRGTNPLRSALVAHVFGARYMTTLFSIALVVDQAGGCLGARLGGMIFDMTGSYDVMWRLAIGPGILPAAPHMPIAGHPLRAPA